MEQGRAKLVGQDRQNHCKSDRLYLPFLTRKFSMHIRFTTLISHYSHISHYSPIIHHAHTILHHISPFAHHTFHHNTHSIIIHISLHFIILYPIPPHSASQFRTSSVIPNCIAKRRKSVSGARSGVFVGDQLESDECDTYAQLVFKRPHDRGYLVDCESEAAIWSRAFSAQVLNVPQRQPSDVRLLLSRPLFQPSALQRDTNELVFEHFGFGALACLSTPLMASLALTSNSGGSGGSGGSSGSNNISNFSNISGNIGNNSISNNSGNNSINNSSGDTSNSGSASVMAQMRETRSMLLVDSGFSFSHVVPVLRGRVCLEAVRRVNVGGKALTNYLKELLSLRQYDMSEETHLVNVIKERLCFVSLDFMGDLNASRLGASGVASHLGVSGVGNHGKASLENPIRQRYVLPDYTHSKLGYVKAPGESVVPDEQVCVSFFCFVFFYNPNSYCTTLVIVIITVLLL